MMKKTVSAGNRRSLLIALTFLGLIAAIAFLPSMFNSGAGKAQQKPETVVPDLEDYDIRTDKKAAATLLNFRQAAGKDAVAIADVSDDFVAGEKKLRQNVPTLKIEYNAELRNPGLIAPDVAQGSAFLTAPSSASRAEILRDFLRDNDSLVGMNDEQINNLKVTADYTNPNGELSFVSLEQFIDEIPVFRSEIRAGFNQQGAMFRVINNSAPELDYNNLSKDFGDPAEAVARAAGYLNHTLKKATRNDALSSGSKVVFGEGEWATTAEKMYFPTEIGVARPAWRVLVWETGDAFYVIVDAETGTMLYRENITYDQTQAATYNVYANTTNLLKTMPNPAPLAAPGLLNPTLGTQGTLQPRTSVTLIGNEAPNTFNNLGWITDGANGTNGHTDGNNVAAGVDRDTTNGIDNVVAGTNRVFNFAFTPGAGPNNTGGDDPLTPAYQNGAVTNLFYVTNRFHDITYTLGFTEAAKNFQNDNFGRGGAAADRISAEAQDNTPGGTSCPAQPCYNNANFSTPADGGRGRMQMYIWNQPTPDRDGDFDAEIIVHELTHGLFGRLHNGVGGTQAGQMNEGTADFFAHVLLSNYTDPINTVSTTGSYATLLLRSSTFTSNYYYGIRRFPKAVLAFTGGPNNRPHNPLTFADIDPAQMSLIDGAFAPAFTGSATAVHDGGEIWSSMMWEVRAKIVQRLGAEAGNRRVLQLAMDGMKIAPSNPTMLQERNAIIAAAQANGYADDVADIWAGFAVRGMGFNATNPTGNTVTESYDLPNVQLAETGFSVADSLPGGDNDGFAEPGETVQLTVPVVNNTGSTITNVVATVTGGGSANYGTLTNGQTVNRQIAYAIPSNATCGDLHTVSITVSSVRGTVAAQTRSFRLGAPIFSGASQNFDGVTAPALPIGWTQSNSGANTGWVTNTVLAGSVPNAAYAPSPAADGQSELITSARITSASAQLAFKNYYNTESTWDGMVLEIQIGNGAFQDIIAAGGSFVSGNYNTAMDASSPFGSRQGWSGNSVTFINTVVNLPATANNQTVTLKWRTASDSNTAPTVNPGHRIDDVVLTGGLLLTGYTCAIVPPTMSVSGAVTYGIVEANQSAAAVSGVSLNAAGSSAVSAASNSSGAYQLSGLTAGGNYTVTPTKTDEVKGINSLDATRIQQHLVGITTLTANQLVAADTDGNGAVNSLDATRIQQRAVGINTQNVIGKWKFVPANRQYNSISSNAAAENYQAVLVGEVSGNWASASAFADDSSTKESLLPKQTNPLETAERFGEKAAQDISERVKQSNNFKPVKAQTESAQTGVAVNVSLPTNARAATGTTVTIPVTIGATPAGSSIESFDFTVFYNPAVLQPASPVGSNAGTLSSGCSVLSNSPTSGRVIVSGACAQAITTTTGGVLYNLQFTVIGSASQTSALTFTNPATSANTFQFNNGSPAAATTNGQFTVFAPTAASVSVSGRVMNSAGRGISSVTITLTDSQGNQQSAQTTSFGYYNFSNIEAGETVTITAKARRYKFAQSSIVRTTNESVTDADFVSQD
jgi:Zn-dependent metalloprotease